MGLFTGRRPAAARRLLAAAATVAVVAVVVVPLVAWLRVTAVSSPVQHGGFFPVLVEDAPMTVFALTTTDLTVGPAEYARFLLSQRPPVSERASRGVADLVEVDATLRPEMAGSAYAARAAAALLLRDAAPLVVVSAPDPGLVGGVVAALDGVPASPQVWRDTLAGMVERISVEGVSTFSQGPVLVTLADGTSFPVRSNGAMVSLAVLPPGIEQRAAEYPEGSFLMTSQHFWRVVPDVDLRPGIPSSVPVLAPLLVEGPSAGLAFALAHVDAALAGRLSNGRVLAASGVVEPSGGVGPVGGFPAKGEAARAAGADVLLVPAGSYPIRFDRSTPVWEVASLAEAVALLCPDADLTDVRVSELCVRVEGMR